jgi:hypothetical protein
MQLTSRTINIGWRVIGSVFAVGALTMGTAQAVSQVAHEEETIVESFAAAELTGVSVSNDQGEVLVVAHDDDVVSVTAEISNGLVATDHAMRIEDGVLMIESSCPFLLSDFCWVDYTIAMPADLALTVRNDDSGVSAIGVDGPVDISSEHGSVEVDGAGESLRLRSEHGRIAATNLRATTVDARSEHGSVRLGFVNAPEEVVARSEHGSVEVVLPDDQATYRVDLSSSHGSTDLLVRTDPASARTVTAHSGHGNVVVRY